MMSSPEILRQENPPLNKLNEKHDVKENTWSVFSVILAKAVILTNKK